MISDVHPHNSASFLDFHFDGKTLKTIRHHQDAFAQHCQFFGTAPGSQLIPFFCRKGLLHEMEGLAPKLHAELNRLSAQFFFDPEKFPGVKIPERFKNFTQGNLAYGDDHPLIRVDCFLGDKQDELSILEVNSADPSAYAWHDWILEGFQRNLHEWIPDSLGNLVVRPLMPDFMSMVSAYFARFQRLEAPGADLLDFCLIMPEDAEFSFDFRALKNWLLQAGARSVTIKSPVSFEKNRNTVYIRDSFEDVFDHPVSPQAEEYLGAVADQSICVFPPSASLVGDQKSLLPYLCKDLPILETINLGDLDSLRVIGPIEARKDDFVLKPSSGYGGQGVVIGRSVSHAEWIQALNKAKQSKDSYVVQKYMEPDTYYDGLDQCLKQSTFSFWIFRGKFSGAFARVSNSSITNYKNGGAVLPVVFR